MDVRNMANKENPKIRKNPTIVPTTENTEPESTSISSLQPSSQTSINANLTLYNPIKGTISNIPQLPRHWIQIHRVAATASVVSGATTYAITSIVTNALTYTASSAVSITGSIVSHGTRLVAGDLPAMAVSAGASGLSTAVQTVGLTAGSTFSMITSAAVAALVGSSVMMGTMVYDLAQSFRKPDQNCIDMSPAESLIENYDYDFVIYDTPPSQSSV